jgi:hypothetical protein
VLTIGVGTGPVSPLWGTLACLHFGEAQDIWTVDPLLYQVRARTAVGATTIFLAGCEPGPTASLAVLASLKAGDRLRIPVWDLINTDAAFKPTRELLRGIRDELPIPEPTGNELELTAYFTLLTSAGRTSIAAFDKAARRGVPYRALMEEARKYRGDVILIQGKLRRLERFDAPAQLSQAGFANLYEGWIYDQSPNTYCVLCTELPPGVPEGDKLDLDVSFAGYFFKKYRYTVGEGPQKRQRDAPLLIGRMPQLLKGPAGTAAEENWPHALMYVFLGLVAATVIGVIGLTLWFRRQDNLIRQRLAQIAGPGFALPSDEEEKKPSAGVTIGPSDPTLYVNPGNGAAESSAGTEDS